MKLMFCRKQIVRLVRQVKMLKGSQTILCLGLVGR